MNTKHRIATIAAVAVACGSVIVARQNEPRNIPQSDTSFIDADGTAHVTRVVPVPTTISPEAQQTLRRQMSDVAAPETLAERRSKTDAWQSRAGEEARSLYPVTVAADTMAGVPVRIITPLAIPQDKASRVLINLHGGGFHSDCGYL